MDLKQKIDSIVKVKDSMLSIYKKTIILTLEYLEDCQNSGETLPISFAIHQRIVKERMKNTSLNLPDLELMIKDYTLICKEMGYNLSKKLDKKNKYREELKDEFFFVQKKVLKSLSNPDYNDELYQYYRNILSDFCNYEFVLGNDDSNPDNKYYCKFLKRKFIGIFNLR